MIARHNLPPTNGDIIAEQMFRLLIHFNKPPVPVE
jgi:hypothetical protein